MTISFLMKTSYVTLFLWSILTFSPLYSQLIDGNQRIETFGNEQGFLQNTISAISSDNKGHLWFATPNGLIRYDGYSFDNFSHDPKDPSPLPDNFIINLLRDKMGRLWIGTKEGLCLYFSDEERFLRLDNTIRNETFIKEDHIGNIWIGKDSKLHVYESEKVQFEDKYNSIDFTSVLKGRSIKDILFISSSEFLLVTNTKIYKVELTDKSKYTFKIKPITFNYKFRGIKNILQSENSFWIGTFNGLHRAIIEHDHLTIVKSYFTNIQKPSIPKYYITSLFLDSEKQLWIGTFDNGMLRYNAKKDNFISYRFNGIKNKTKLSSNRIFCFYEDSFGVLWTGTVQGGINKLDKNQKPFYN